MQVKRIADCSKRSILQYFRPSLSYHLSLRSLFCLFLSGCFTQDLLYIVMRIYPGLARQGLTNIIYVMPNGDPRDRFFYPPLTLLIDSYNTLVKYLR